MSTVVVISSRVPREYVWSTTFVIVIVIVILLFAPRVRGVDHLLIRVEQVIRSAVGRIGIGCVVRQAVVSGAGVQRLADCLIKDPTLLPGSQSHLRQRVDHLWSQIQPGGSPAAERTVVASWPRLKTTMIVNQIKCFFLRRKKPNLAPAVLLCIESPGGKLEGVPSRRLSGKLIVNVENVTLMFCKDCLTC